MLFCWLDYGHTDKLWTPKRKCRGGFLTGAQGTSYLQACFLTQVIVTSYLPLKSCPDLQQHALLAWKSLLTHGLMWKDLSFKIHCSNPQLSLVSGEKMTHLCYTESFSSLWVKKQNQEKPCTSLYLYLPLQHQCSDSISFKRTDIYRVGQYLVYLGFALKNKVYWIIGWSVVQM